METPSTVYIGSTDEIVLPRLKETQPPAEKSTSTPRDVRELFFVQESPCRLGKKDQLFLLAESPTGYKLVAFDKNLLHKNSPVFEFVRKIDAKTLAECGVDVGAATGQIFAAVVDVPAESLRTHIDSPEEFLQFLQSVSKLMIKEKSALMSAGTLGWLAVVEFANKIEWKKRQPLLEPIEYRALSPAIFAKADRTPANAAGYPNVPAADRCTAPTYQNIKVSEDAKTTSAETWREIFRHLRETGSTSLLGEIVKTHLLSYSKFTEMLQAGVVEEIAQSVPAADFAEWFWYSARIMFLEELSTYRSGGLKNCCCWREDDEGLISAEELAERTKLPRFVLSADSVCGLAAATAGTAAVDTLGSSNPFTPWAKSSVLAGNFVSPFAIAGERGIYSNDEIKQRIDEFTCGVFSGVSWSGPGYRLALTGSTIAACAIKNPLEQVVAESRKWPSPVAARNAFWEEYYPSKFCTRIAVEEDSSESSDDLFSKGYDDDDVVQLVDNHAKKPASDDTASTVRVSMTRKTGKRYPRRIQHRPPRVAVQQAEESQSESSEENDTDERDQTGVGYSDIDIAVECSKGNFKKVAAKIFEEVSAFTDAPLELVTIDTENFYRFRIVGLRRDIEIFHVFSIPATIAKFHLAEVRAWWDGKTAWTFPTFVGAAHTGLSADIRWTSNKKNVRDTILKYHQRGFGIVLSPKDHTSLTEHLNKSELWKGMPTAKMPNVAMGWRFRRAVRDFNSNPFKHKSSLCFNPSAVNFGLYSEIRGRQPLFLNVKFDEKNKSTYEISSRKKTAHLLKPMPY